MGSREVILLIQAHTAEKTDHLYCTLGCKQQRHPLIRASPRTLLQGRLGHPLQARRPVVPTLDHQPAPAKSKEDLARDLVEAYTKVDYKGVAARYGEVAASNLVATAMSSDTKAVEAIRTSKDIEGEPELHMTNPADVLHPPAHDMHKAKTATCKCTQEYMPTTVGCWDHSH